MIEKELFSPEPTDINNNRDELDTLDFIPTGTFYAEGDDKQTKERLDQIFSVQNIRKVNNDYTIRFNGQYFQLDKEQATTVYKKDAVIVEEHLNGKIKLRLKNSCLNYTVLPERPKKEINVKLAAITRSNQPHYKPPADHPWRRQFLLNKQKNMATECVLTRKTMSA